MSAQGKIWSEVEIFTVALNFGSDTWTLLWTLNMMDFWKFNF